LKFILSATFLTFNFKLSITLSNCCFPKVVKEGSSKILFTASWDNPFIVCNLQALNFAGAVSIHKRAVCRQRLALRSDRWSNLYCSHKRPCVRLCNLTTIPKNIDKRPLFYILKGSESTLNMRSFGSTHAEPLDWREKQCLLASFYRQKFFWMKTV